MPAGSFAAVLAALHLTKVLCPKLDIGLGGFTALVWHMLVSESIGRPYCIVDFQMRFGNMARNFDTVIAISTISFLTAKT